MSENTSDKETEIEENTVLSSQQEIIDLEYGDIIQLIAPSNSEFDKVMFFVNYIDEEKIKLLNIANSDFHELNIRADGNGFTDESIIAVYLLDRSNVSGYARQKGLVTGVWIDIHFSKLPTVTAEITDLEEDQIELTLYPSLKIIYIDFAYRGIPEDIPIEKFVIRDKPATLKNSSSLSVLREQVAQEYEGEDESVLFSQQDFEEPTQEYLSNGESIINIPEGAQPDINIKSLLREEYLKTQPKTGIIFGDFLDVVEQYVEVADNRKRYNIDVQINSYMDELLSTVPYSARTTKFMTRIHILVERYKELREMYSEFDEAGNIKWLKKTDPTTHKPLIHHIEKMDTKLTWIVPIVSTIKNIYEDKELPFSDEDDVEKFDQDVVLYDQQNMINDLYYEASSEQNKYTNMYRQLNANYMTPMKPPLNEDDYLAKIPVSITTEAFVENRKYIYSSTVSNNNEKIDRELKDRRFCKQVYTNPLLYLTRELRYNDKKHYVQKPLTSVDELTMQSLMTLPMPIIQYSRAFLPGTSILDRIQLSALNYMPSFLFKKKTNIVRVQINDFSKELNFENLEDETEKFDEGVKIEKDFHYLTSITQYTLKKNLLEDEDKFHKFLQVVIPNIWTCIRFLSRKIKNQYSFQKIISMLEPFMIYSKDISYTQYKEIRYMINNQIKNLKQVLQEKIKEFADYKNFRYNVEKLPQLLTTIFSEKRELTELMDTGYKIGVKKPNTDNSKYTNDEILQKILTTDDAELFTLLMQSMMIVLVTPESILKDEPVEIDWMDENGNASRNCGTEVLAKKYMKIDDLFKDNGKEEVFFDKEFDETNYSIIKKYEKEKKEMVDDQKFADFLAENLVQKHGIVREKSQELAQILISGKKRVSEGQYAVLEISPKLSKKVSESTDSFSPSEIASESEARTKYTYYIRKKNEWVYDDSLDEMAFMDSNTLFCNLKSLKCVKNNDSKSADKACEFGPSHFYKLEREKALKEFERRYEVTHETLEKMLELKIIKQTRLASRMQTLRDIQREKSTLLAYHIGLRAKHSADDLVISPRASLLRIIYGQKDFTEKQLNIVKFVEKFCREPMVAERDEDPYWKYCIDTNIKLIPSFVCELANQFVYFGQQSYADKLNEILANQGEEEDGFIYDRYTHEVIKKIDNVQEDEYNEAGFRVITNAVIEPDIGSIVRDKLTKKQQRVFEGVSEEIYKIYSALSSKISPFSEEVWQNVNNLANEFITNTQIIKTESDYKKESDFAKEKFGKTAVSYEIMRNKKVIQIVASVLFIIIQTSIPSFKGNKTFPGCVLSFEGYPLTGEENLHGIEYIACILKGISAQDIKPWNSVHKTGVNLLKDQMKELIKKYMIDNAKIKQMYQKKIEYIALSSDKEIVPDQHRIEKWQQFMPPLKDTSIKFETVSSDFIKELWSLMRKGHKDQSEKELTFKSKVALYGNAIIESIQEIVKTKTLLLKTSGNVPYLQNSCCNEDNEKKKAIQYFADEEGSLIQKYYLSVNNFSNIIQKIHILTKSAFIRNKFSNYQKPILPTEIMEENIYSAFIYYCGLDREKIPLEFKTFFSEIPEGYNNSLSLNEKIKIIKNKRKIDKDDMDYLMRIVRQKNSVELIKSNVPNKIESFQNVLTRIASYNEPPVLDEIAEYNMLIRGSLQKLLGLYNPDKMYSIDMIAEDEVKELNNLKGYLEDVNNIIFVKIMKFLDKYLNISKKNKKKLSEFLTNIDKWNIDIESENSKLPNYYDTSFYRVQQYFKNSLYDLTQYFPSLIINREVENTAMNYYNESSGERNSKLKNDRIHRYWNISFNDYSELKKSIKKYQNELYKFQEDEVFIELIQNISPKLMDLNNWINDMPIFSSLLKDREYFYLFDKSSVQMLDKYLIYSALYEYIKAGSENVLLQKEREIGKQKMREGIKERNDVFSAGISQQEIDEELLDDYEELEEVEFMERDEDEEISLNERISKFLMIFLNMYKDNKKKIDYTYYEIERNMNIERTKEKERIMKRFKMDNKGNEKNKEERDIEFAKKKLGLGIWNVGKQKSIFQYNKDTSDRERSEISEQQKQNELQEGISNIVEENIDIDGDGLMPIEEEDENEEIDEGFDISDYNAENDGGYYADDRTYLINSNEDE
uniref:Uncharacterized protein n=1 Tax=viral metagenome TaxID=1070528 RepID=A0A6C0HYS7_9ZZZZ